MRHPKTPPWKVPEGPQEVRKVFKVRGKWMLFSVQYNIPKDITYIQLIQVGKPKRIRKPVVEEYPPVQ